MEKPSEHYLQLSDATKHRLFIDQMINEIGSLAEDCFIADIDSEVCWRKFREQLKYWKKEHTTSYLKFLETDYED